MNNQDKKGAYSVNEFMSFASIGRTKLYQEINEGRLKARKLGAKTVILASDAEAWLNSLPEAA